MPMRRAMEENLGIFRQSRLNEKRYLSRLELPRLRASQQGEELGHRMALDSQCDFGDPVHRQLGIDAAKFFDHALRVDGIGERTPRVQHVDALPPAVLLRGDPGSEARGVKL